MASLWCIMKSTFVRKKKRTASVDAILLCFERNCLERQLLSDSELLLGDDGTVAVDVLLDKVVKQATTLTYKHLQGAFSCMVLMILLQVSSKMRDTERE